MSSAPPDQPAGPDGDGDDPPGRNDDALFADIVAGWDPALATPLTNTPAPHEPPAGAPRPPTAAEQGWRLHIPPEDDDLDDTFEPPPLRPLPLYDWGFWVVGVGLTVGPLWLLFLVLQHRVSGLPVWAAGGLIAAALVVLMVRGTRSDAPRDPDDDGARV